MPMPKKYTPRKRQKERVAAILASIADTPKTSRQIADELGLPVVSVRATMRQLSLERYPDETFKAPKPVPGARIVSLTDTRHNAHDCIQPEHTKGGSQWMNG